MGWVLLRFQPSHHPHVRSRTFIPYHIHPTHFYDHDPPWTRKNKKSLTFDCFEKKIWIDSYEMILLILWKIWCTFALNSQLILFQSISLVTFKHLIFSKTMNALQKPQKNCWRCLEISFYSSEFLNESNGIFVLGAFFFLQNNSPQNQAYAPKYYSSRHFRRKWWNFQARNGCFF